MIDLGLVSRIDNPWIIMWKHPCNSVLLGDITATMSTFLNQRWWHRVKKADAHMPKWLSLTQLRNEKSGWLPRRNAMPMGCVRTHHLDSAHAFSTQLSTKYNTRRKTKAPLATITHRENFTTLARAFFFAAKSTILVLRNIHSQGREEVIAACDREHQSQRVICNCRCPLSR